MSTVESNIVETHEFRCVQIKYKRNKHYFVYKFEREWDFTDKMIISSYSANLYNVGNLYNLKMDLCTQ